VVSVSEPPREPPIYRPFALLAFATTVLGGTPIGLWMLSWLYLGVSAVPIEWVLLHANLQILGFFATLIPGVAQHLIARFTGRPVTRHPMSRWLLALLGSALALRGTGTVAGLPLLVLAAALLQGAAFALFASWVWRALDPPPLGLLRRHLTLSTGWFALACLLEAGLRAQALVQGVAVPSMGGMRAVHLMALFGGVIGWVLGVLLRAGPMFIPSWSVPPRAARLMTWLLALGVVIGAAGEAGDWSPTVGIGLARLGELIALGTVAAVFLMGGAWRSQARRALPMLARSGEETRIFRLAVASAGLAAVGAVLTAVAAWAGRPAHLLTDVVRHLVSVGFLASVVVAMTYRLIPVLELTALPWPRLRVVAFWALAAGVVLRTAEVLVGGGVTWVAPLVPLGGLLVWLALASVAATLAGAVARAVRQPSAHAGGAPAR